MPQLVSSVSGSPGCRAELTWGAGQQHGYFMLQKACVLPSSLLKGWEVSHCTGELS